MTRDCPGVPAHEHSGRAALGSDGRRSSIGHIGVSSATLTARVPIALGAGRAATRPRTDPVPG